MQKENNNLYSFINNILQTFKDFFRRILKPGTEKGKDNVVEQITDYYDRDFYKSKDLHDIADNTSKEDEINNYLYDYRYGKDDDFDIEM